MNGSETIYHGSYMDIEFPEIRKHKFTKYFSLGFYCTQIQEEAEKLAGSLMVNKSLREPLIFYL